MDNRTLNKEEHLFLSIQENKLEEVKFWLDAGAYQLAKNLNGKTPIEYAAELKNWNCVKQIAQYKKGHKDENSADLSGYGYALKVAVDENQDDIAELLMDKGAPLVSTYSVKSGYYAIHRAIQNKNFALIKSLLDHKANPSIKTQITKENDKEITPLQLAITMNELKIIDLLLKAGANQSVKDSEGDIAIEYAAKLKHWDCVKKIAAFQKNKKNNQDAIAYEYVLNSAINEDQNDVADILLDKNLSFDNVFNTSKGFYALHKAIAKKDFALVKSLLDHQADPSIKTKITKENDKETTPLELAIKMNELKIIDLLLKAGAKQSMKISEGNTPIEYAAKLKHWDCVKLLAKYHKDQETYAGYGYALKSAVNDNQNGISEVLMQSGAPLAMTYTIKTGHYALHQAIYNKNFALVKSLLDYKADPSIKTKVTKENDKETTPLELAIALKENKIIGLLLSAGASQTMKNSDKNTPIEYAANLDHWDCVQQLLEYPCEQSSQPEELVYCNILLKTVEQNKINIAQLLMKKCTSVNSSHFLKTGRYALHTAIENGNIVLVKSLLEYKADPLLKTEVAEESKEQITAVHLALQLGKKEIIDLLMKTLEELHAENEKYFSPTLSYYTASDKMNSYLKEHKCTDALTQITLKTNESYIILFKLAYLNHFIKNKTTDKSPLFINIPDFFEFVAEEGHVFIAQSLLEAISRMYETNINWSETTKSEVRGLLNSQGLTPITQESSFLLKGLSELKLLESEYSNQLQNKIKTNQVDIDFKELLYKIGAIKYIRHKILSKEYDFYGIKDKLEMLFGIDIFQGNCWKRNPFKHCINNIIKALEKHEKLYGKKLCDTPTKLQNLKATNEIYPPSYNPYAQWAAPNTNIPSSNLIYSSLITQSGPSIPIATSIYPTISAEGESVPSVTDPTNKTNTFYPSIVLEGEPCHSIVSAITAQDSQPGAAIIANNPSIISDKVAKVEENPTKKSTIKRSNSESDISLLSISNNSSSHFHKIATQKHSQSIIPTEKRPALSVSRMER